MWHKDLCGKTSLRWERKNHGCGPTGPHELHYEQPGYKVFSKISRDIQHTHHVANRQQQQPLERKITAKQSISVSVPFGNHQTALKPQIQSAPNLVDKLTYEYPTYTPNFRSIGHCLPAQTVHLPKLLSAETAAVRTEKIASKSDAKLTQTSNQLTRSK